VRAFSGGACTALLLMSIRTEQSPSLNKTFAFIREIRGQTIFNVHFEEVF
jgi:hypothetical protein